MAIDVAMLREQFRNAPQAVWGKVPPSAEIQIIADVLNNPIRYELTLSLVVRVKPHTRLVQGYRYDIRGGDFHAQEHIPGRVLALLSFTDIPPYTRNLTAVLAARLYEFDTRIGTVLEYRSPQRDVRQLPECPLFDPPRILLPQWGYAEHPLAVPCALCREPFRPDNEPMWGGGNVMWVHVSCWTKGLPKASWPW